MRHSIQEAPIAKQDSHHSGSRRRLISRREFVELVATAGLLASCQPVAQLVTPTSLPAPTLTPAPTETPVPTPNATLVQTVAPVAVAAITPSSAATASSDTLVLINGTLIDGTGANPVPDAVVIIRGERVVAAGPRTEVIIPPGARRIDVGGATILPGFINAHVHNAYEAQNLKAWAQAGVTTVRDEGILSSSQSLPDLIAKRSADWSQPQYARLVSAGWMTTVPGGYGGLYITSPTEARQKTLEQLDQGADLIKLSMEDGYGGRSDLPLLSAEELVAIVAAAHERGARVSAHVTEARYLASVVDAGVDDAAHMPWDTIPDELLQRLVADDIYVVPTLTVMEAYGALTGSQANLKRFVAAGGQVALGNDYTNIPQNNFPHFELGMPMHEITRMREAGMTPMQIIVAATKNAAHVCHLDKELGTLEVGKTADVLVVNGDPLQDLNTLTQVRLVIHNGSIIQGEN